MWQWFSERILVQMWRIQEKKSQGWWIKSTLNFAIHIHDQSTKHLSDIAFTDCLIEMCFNCIQKRFWVVNRTNSQWVISQEQTSIKRNVLGYLSQSQEKGPKPRSQQTWHCLGQYLHYPYSKETTCLVRHFQICAPAWPLAGTVSVYRPCYILTKSHRPFWLLIKSWYTFDTRKELQEVEKEMCKGSGVMRGQQHLSKQKKSGNLELVMVRDQHIESFCFCWSIMESRGRWLSRWRCQSRQPEFEPQDT